MILVRILSLLFALCVALSSCNKHPESGENPVTDAIRSESLHTLERVLDDTLKWEKVHAAEFLISLQYIDKVQTAFLKEQARHGQEPVYRIGIWRVLAQVSASSGKKNEWIARIDSVYRDPSAPDRLHAAESMAKLAYAFEPVRGEQDSLIKLFSIWSRAYGTAAAANAFQAELIRKLDARRESGRERKLAAYALRHLGILGVTEEAALNRFALNEPDSSVAKVFLLSAALKHTPTDSIRMNLAIRRELLRIAAIGTKAERYELGIVLGEKGSQTDLTLLQRLLEHQEVNAFRNADSVDVQLAAAYAILRIDRRFVPSLAFPDWIVIVVYGIIMLWIGWYYSRKNKTREDYLLGGRKMNPVAVGISLFATLLSTLSYLSYPGEMIQNGPVIFAGMFAFPFVYYVAGWWLIPRIMKMNVTSAYEILERKFGLSARMMATFMFLSLRFLWMATIIYVTVEVALFSVVPFDKSYALPIGVGLMLITIIYTAMGGLKAVVVTDVLQSVIFLGGALISILLVCFHFGSFTSWFPDQWPVVWSPPQYGFDARERSTVGNAMLMLFVWYICTIGSDQMAIQRYLATKDIQAARKSLRVSLYTNLLAKCLLGLVGLAVFAFFSHNPHLLSDGKTLQQQADTLFPRFILVGLPVGLSGLVVAGLLAAAMSSLSSGVNSVSSVISEDIVQRFRRSVSTGESLLKQVKTLSYLTGTLVMVLSIYIGNVEGNLFDVVTKVVNLFVGPLFVLFFMALFVPFATSRGAILGGLAAIVAACAVAFYGIMGITVFWILPVSLVVGVFVGTIISFIEHHLNKSGNHAE